MYSDNWQVESAEDIKRWKKEIEDLKSENLELRKALQTVCGHSNCYCGNCKAISHKYWKPVTKKK